MFLFDFFCCHNAEVLILIGYLTFKTKIITIFNFTWGKNGHYDHYDPSPGQNGHVSKIYIFLK